MAGDRGLSMPPDGLAAARARLGPAQLAEIARLSGLAETVAGLAHQLSQPLGAIGNYAAIGLHQLSDGQSTQEVCRCLEQIAEQAHRASRTVKRIRRLAGRAPSDRSRTDLNALIRRTVSLLDHRARARQVELRLALDDRLPDALIDPDLIERVIAALVDNAVEAAGAAPPKKRRVDVRTSAADGRLRVAVEDSAAGLTAEQIERAFEPLYTTKPGRLGLGLTLARAVVAAHGGRLEAERHEEATTVFHFTLPVATGRDHS